MHFSVYLINNSKHLSQATSWISNLQFHLKHQPKLLEEMFSSSAWQNIISLLKNEEINISETSKFLNTFPLDITKNIYEILEFSTKLCGQTETFATPLAIDIARCLLTNGGTINLGVLITIKNILNEGKLDINPSVKNHLIAILSFLEHDSDFTQRLETCEDPPADSPQALLIQKLLDIEEDDHITKHMAQVAILSAMLWPLIQHEMVSSCFATATAMRLSSFPDGLKQKLEDYLALVASGSITRGDIKYPLIYDKEAFFSHFSGEHLFARAHEYLLAGMNDQEKEKDWIIKKTVSAIKNKNLSDLKLPQKFYEKVQRRLSKSCQISYLPTKLNKQFRTWRIVDSNTREPIDKNSFENLIIDSFKSGKEKSLKTKKQNVKKFHGIEKRITGFIISSRLYNQIIPVSKQRGLAWINPIKYSRMLDMHSLFSLSNKGGYSLTFLEKYNARKGLLINKENSKPLEAILHRMRYMTDAEKEAAQKNPLLLERIGNLDRTTNQGHSFNIRMGHIMQTFNEETLHQYIESSKKMQLELKMNKTLNDELTQQNFKGLWHPFIRGRRIIVSPCF